jgi:hypothetical protein
MPPGLSQSLQTRPPSHPHALQRQSFAAIGPVAKRNLGERPEMVVRINRWHGVDGGADAAVDVGLLDVGGEGDIQAQDQDCEQPLLNGS